MVATKKSKKKKKNNFWYTTLTRDVVFTYIFK